MFMSIFKNKIIIYLVTRYGTYALQFIVSLVIAVKLGPYYLGVYGFLTLILNYFSQINLGIPHSLNVLLIHNKRDEIKCKDYIGNSFVIYGVISIILICLFICLLLSDTIVSQKYPISLYHCFLICVIAILQYYSTLCSTILRVKNKVNQLAIAQSSNVLLNLFVIFFFYENTLIYVLMICQISSLSIFIFFTWKEKLLPDLKRVHYKLEIQKTIIKKGLYLFLYNSCFYFILISIRTIISGNYTVEEFGLFNFSFTLSHAVLLLIEALTVIIFPKIIDLLSSKDYEKINTTIEQIRISFVSTSHLLIYVAMLFFPLVTAFLPQYDGALTSMNLIALTILMNTNSYGYSSFLIAQNKEKKSAGISIIALIINILIGEVLVEVCKVEFSYVVISVLITYFIFSLLIFIESKMIMHSLSKESIIKDFFPIRLLVPYCCSLLISLFSLQQIIFLPIILFILMNVKDVKKMIAFGKKIIKNPDMINV